MMADDVVDYSGTSDSDSDCASDKVPSTGRLPAPAGSCILRMGLASFGPGSLACRMRMRTIVHTIAGKEFDRRL